MNLSKTLLAGCLAAVLSAWGCSEDGHDHDHDHDHGPAKPAATAPAVDASYFLAAAPEGAASILKLRESAKEGDEVVVRGVIGGRKDPMSGDRAVMTVVDASLSNQCTAPGDSCDTPWDYCCADSKEVTANAASVQIMDESGKLLAASFAAGDRLKPLQVVVVKGKVGPRPDPAAFTILAEGIYAEPVKP